MTEWFQAKLRFPIYFFFYFFMKNLTIGRMPCLLLMAEDVHFQAHVRG